VSKYFFKNTGHGTCKPHKLGSLYDIFIGEGSSREVGNINDKIEGHVWLLGGATHTIQNARMPPTY
jgi:hypothetical protein